MADRVVPDPRAGDALADWLEQARGGATRSEARPTDELLAEHQLMEAALAALEVEARTLLRHRPLRPDFWARAVDFVGNYVHRCHRAKEEHLYRALGEWGVVQPGSAEILVREHERAQGLTRDLCDSVDEGDWEKTLRMVSQYLHFMRPHMRREEEDWLGPLGRQLDAGQQEALRTAFRKIERRALAARGRAHYLGVVEQLLRDTGVESPLA